MEFAQGGSIELQELETGQDGTYANLLFFDPRGKNFGIRIISMQPDLDVQGHLQHCTEHQRQLLYNRLGETPAECFHNKLPFMFNYDFMNAISLRKGCYLGQEVVSRGLRAGIVRRRIFPFILDKSDEEIPQDTPIKIEENEIGKVLFSSPGQGTAIINYIPLLEANVQWPLAFTYPFKGTLLNPFQDKLNKYFSEVKDKQRVFEELDL